MRWKGVLRFRCYPQWRQRRGDQSIPLSSLAKSSIPCMPTSCRPRTRYWSEPLGGPSRVLFDKLTADQNSLIWLREQADARLYGGQGEFDHEFWIRRLSESIKNVQDLAVHANLPISGSASIPPATNVAKYILLALAEQLGRDRAILVSAIARKAPLDQQELHELATQRIVANTACRRLEDLLRESPPATKDSLAGLDCSGLLSSYERLRQGLVEAGLGGANYPLTAEKWFDEASRHIAQVTRLIDSTDALIAAEADRHRSRSLRNLALAALVLLLLTGLSGRLLWSLRRRVFIPIKTLERAARTVSGGALNAPIPPGRDDEIGSLSRSIVQMRDTLVEALRRGEQSTSELRKLSAVIEHNANAITITDAHGSIQYANPGFAAITGYDCKEALGRKAGFWRSGMTPPELYRSMWASITRGKVWQGTLINRRKDGRLYWASLQISPVIDEHGVLTNFIGIQHDITDKKEIEERLELIEAYDRLTGLPRVQSRESEFSQLFRQASEKGARATLTLFGVGRIKELADGMGVEAADEIIKIVTRRLRSVTRGPGLLAHYGMGEFVFANRTDENPTHAEVDIARIVAILRTPMVVQGRRIEPMIQSGLAIFPDHGHEVVALLRRAAIALHHAQTTGRQTCTYSESLEHSTKYRLDIETALHRSIDSGGFELHYQPKISLADGRICGVETLLRWRHPESGEAVSPAVFVPIAEQCGLIGRLGAWVLHHACRQAAAWQHEGILDLQVAVNLSAHQLRNPALTTEVARAIEQSGIEPSRLRLELTESALVEDTAHAEKTLNALKALGVSSLDRRLRHWLFEPELLEPVPR